MYTISIAVYAQPHFYDIDTFKAWWDIENLALEGKKPRELVQTLKGIDQILQNFAYLKQTKQ